MKIRNFFLLSLAFLLIGCDKKLISSESSSVLGSSIVESTDTTSPRIRGMEDKVFKLSEEVFAISYFNLLDGITAKDDVDGDITSKVTYKVYDFYKDSEINLIVMSNHYKYLVRYRVSDNAGNSDEATSFIIVGQPNLYLNADGTLKTFPSIKYDLNEVRESYEEVFFQDYNYTGAPGSDSTSNDYNAYTYDLGAGGWGNNEAQTYTKDSQNVTVKDGNLVITALKDSQNKITSARVLTTNSFSKKFLYGVYEVKAKLPDGQGAWPAIWMLPNDWKYGNWPASGEIDIMESSYLTGRNRVLGTVHTASYNHSINTQKGGSTTPNNGMDLYNSYHVYKIEWLPDTMIFYLDNRVYYSFNPTSYSTDVTSKEWPFDQSFHFLFNIAIGGNMGGSISNTLFSDYDVSMYIDYVRVYQSPLLNK